MNIAIIGAAALAAAVLGLTLRPKNGEIALLLTVSAAVMILLSVLGNASEIVNTVQSIVSASGIATGYLTILLKVIGICLITEFAADACRDAGSSALAANVTLAGKLMVTVTALPLYADILTMVRSLVTSR